MLDVRARGREGNASGNMVGRSMGVEGVRDVVVGIAVARRGDEGK